MPVSTASPAGSRRRHRVPALAGSILALLASAAQAADERPFLPARIPESASPPRIDGRLDDLAWVGAPSIGDFLQRSPREGATPSESTSVRLAYTREDLYIAVRCSDSRPDRIVATTRRRDDFSLTEDDQLVVAIDSHADRRNGFFFSTNPLGVRVDAQFFDEGEVFADAWDGAWEARALRDSLGWTAELRIPFSTLRFRRSERNRMGVNLFRRLIRTNEELFSPAIPLRYAAGTPSVSIAREVVFEGITPGRGLWLEPYVAARGQQQHDADRDGSVDTGLDARWTPGGGLAASLSVNTDFAQVEADDRQVNLTRFALFVPEKRDFFLENSGLFAFGAPSVAELFFSRRIGLVDDADGNTRDVPLRVGAKATGQSGRAEYGALVARTGEERGRPGEDFVVARAKVGLAERSWVGALFAHRDGASATAGNSVGADALVRLPGEIAVSTFLAATTSDDDRLGAATSAARLRVERGGEQQAFHLEWLDQGARFDPAIGFLARPASRIYRAGFALPHYADAGVLRRVTPKASFERFEAQSGRLQEEHQELEVTLDALSGDALSLSLERTRDRPTSAFDLPGGITVPAGDYREWRVALDARTKAGRPVSAQFALDAGGFHGGTRTTLSTALLAKTSGRLRAGPEAECSWIRIGHGDAQPLVVRLRTELDFSVSAGLASFLQYDNESEALGWRGQLRYLRREGTEILLVYGLNTRGEDAGDAAAVPRHSVVLKATYRIDL